MKWNYGLIYQDIRKNKGFSQNEICNSQISRTTLSKFENGKLSPSYETMSFLLQQINMTQEEFNYVCNNYTLNEREQIINDFFSSVSNLETEKLKELHLRCLKFLKFSDDFFINDLQKIIHSLLILVDDSIKEIDCFPKIIVSDIWQRISKKDEWYYEEIRLLNCILFHFPIETVLVIVSQLLKTIDRYNNFKPMESLSIGVLLNLSLLLIQNNYFLKAQEVALKACQLSKAAKRYDLLGIATVRYGICLKDSEKIESGIKLLDTCGEESLLKHLLKEVELFS